MEESLINIFHTMKSHQYNICIFNNFDQWYQSASIPLRGTLVNCIYNIQSSEINVIFLLTLQRAWNSSVIHY